MRVVWTLHTDCTKEAAALKVAAWFFTRMGVLGEEIEAAASPEGGYRVRARTSLASGEWIGAVFETLAAAQSVGSSWELCGSVHDDLEIWSTRLSVTGLVAVGAFLRKGD